MLFEAERHEPLTPVEWDEARALEAIGQIAAHAEGNFSESNRWAIHPFDVSAERARTLKPIYYGAAGVIWTLGYLANVRVIGCGRSFAHVLRPLLEAHREDSLGPIGRPIEAYPLGDAGILLLQAKLAPSASAAEELFRVIESNALHPARGLVAPRTLGSLLQRAECGDATRHATLALRSGGVRAGLDFTGCPPGAQC